ncbi:MAG: methyl-accepting chemotaxis protein [Gammaproteobacteria bacterium]
MMSREQGAGSALFLGILLSALLLGAAALHFLSAKSNGESSRQAEVLALTSDAFNAASEANDAVAGVSSAFDKLNKLQSTFANTNSVRAIAETIGGLNAKGFEGSWGLVTMNVKKVIDSKGDILEGLDAAELTSQRVRTLLGEMGKLNAAMSNSQRNQFASMLERFELKAQLLTDALGQRGSDLQANQLKQYQDYLRQVVSALAGVEAMDGVPDVSGRIAQENVDAIQNAMASVSTELDSALDASQKTIGARLAASQINSASRTLYENTTRTRVDAADGAEWWSISWLPLALLGAAFLCGLGLISSAGKAVEAPEPVAAESGSGLADQQQEAILRLLDEMGDLADGDLTVEATVTEDITGAIADAINYAIEALRDLVSTIDGAAESVDSAARQTQASANHLSKASDNQSNQVASATESITKMAHSIDQVSSNAERSSEVARHSVEVAHKGGEAVRRTIDGMNTIRETIQDTSKRIKRLGESSQEIGNIVELINDIAEQTNILALNASIQASMAGEAGRGFGVVADEVQRLAERSTNATKQIEVLVKTIQSDTNEAVVSMERSTTDVVSGALLAENAGASLDEIEKVSNQIASLVQNISGSARQQATAASDVTRNMGVLQEISAQTAENTSATSDSISKLAEMASQLRRSVAGFTLPKEMVMEDAIAEEEAENAILGNLAEKEDENVFIDTLMVNEKNSS